jgi:hypothetical protein
VLALTKVCEAGCAPTTQDPQEGIANALPAKNTGNANADAKTTDLIAFIEFMLSPKS